MRIPANQKLVAINAIKKGDKSVANIANELSVARKTVYSWLNRHKLTPLRIRGKALEDRYLKGLLHPRYKNKDKAIIKLVVTYPEWSIRQIRAHLNNQGLDISYSAIYSCLKRYNCTRFERRCNLKRLWSGPGRLSSDIKLSIVNNCLSGCLLYTSNLPDTKTRYTNSI